MLKQSVSINHCFNIHCYFTNSSSASTFDVLLTSWPMFHILLSVSWNSQGIRFQFPNFCHLPLPYIWISKVFVLVFLVCFISLYISFYPTGTATLWQRCDNVVTTSSLTSSQRCGKFENESCGDPSFRRCDNVVVRHCQDIATTLLQRRYNINQW